VEIIRRDEDIPLYNLKTSKLSEEEYLIKNTVRDIAIMEININPARIPDLRERKNIFMNEIMSIMEKRQFSTDSEQIIRIADRIVMDMVGYGVIDPLLQDKNLEEIMVMGHELPVFIYHKKHGTCETNIHFNSEIEIRNLIEKFARDVHRRIDYNVPILNARLPDGSRINAVIPPITIDGSSITIRKFSEDTITIVDLINYKTISLELAAFLWICVEGFGMHPSNIIVAGGTASGKTSTLNALSVFVPRGERIITIEDTAELHLRHKNRVRLETRPPNVEGRGEVDMASLLKNALRMRPDRILVGEVRGAEAVTLFTAMNTGHEGCMGTIHSNSSHDVITRLRNSPMNVDLSLIPALDLVIMMEKFFDRKHGVIRRISEVTEVSIGETGEIQTNDIYKWSPSKDIIKGTGIPSRTQFRYEEYAEMWGTEFKKEQEQRMKYLEGLVKDGVRDFDALRVKVNEYMSRHMV